MPRERNNLLIPALAGGVAAGVLSAFPISNCFCCLWIIVGAALAVFLYSRDSSQPISSGDGLLLGILTGLIAAFVDFFLSIPFQALNLAFARRFFKTMAQLTEGIPPGWEDWLEEVPLRHLSLPLAIFTLIIRTIIFASLGAIGGVIGVSLFGRGSKKTPPSTSSASPSASF